MSSLQHATVLSVQHASAPGCWEMPAPEGTSKKTASMMKEASVVLDAPVLPHYVSSNACRKHWWASLIVVLALITLGLVTIGAMLLFNRGDEPAPEMDSEESEYRQEYYLLLTREFGSSVSEVDPVQGQALEWMAFKDLPMPDSSTSLLWQRYALVAFYFSQGGPEFWGTINGDAASGWISHGVGVHECDWKGVSCDSKDFVIGLRLPASTVGNFKGTLGTELGKLAKLEHLDLSRHRLQGALPNEWKALTNLATVNLASNLLSSTIPSWIGDLGKLKALVLEGNLWTGYLPSALSKVTSLERLEVQNSLNLQGSLEDILTSMANLKYLDVSKTRISGYLPRAPSNFSMEAFQAWGAPLQGNLTGVSSWSKLQTFSIGEIDELAGEIPTEFGLLSDLETLEISYTRAKGGLPSELGLLTKLTTLDLKWSHREGTLPTEYAQLTNLVNMNLAHNTGITGTIPETYGNLTALTSLYLHGTSLSGTVGTEICGLGLRTFSSDCKRRGHELICDCCTECRQFN